MKSFWDLFNFCFSELDSDCKKELEEKIKNAGSYGIASSGELIVDGDNSAAYSDVWENYDIFSANGEKEFVISSYLKENSDLRIGAKIYEIFPILEEDQQGRYGGLVIEYNGGLLRCENHGDGNYSADSFFSKKENLWKALTSKDFYFEKHFHVLEFTEYEIDDEDGEKISVGEGLRLGVVEGWGF